jgi:replicative DNA helicase
MKQIKDLTTKSIDAIKWIKTGDTNLDDIKLISANNSCLIAGKQGSGKTKYVINLVRNLIMNNKNISILWYSFEDDADTIVKSLVSGIIDVDNDNITENTKNNTNYLEAIQILNNSDIVIAEDIKSISDIKTDFITFCSYRKNKFCMLIIDNIITLQEVMINKDDKYNIIRSEIIQLRKTLTSNKYNAYILCLHHVDDKLVSNSDKHNAYRLKDNCLIGTTELNAGFTQIAIFNSLFNYTDIYYDLTIIKEIIEKLTILELTKNRNGRLGIMRYFNKLEYSKFYPINL